MFISGSVRPAMRRDNVPVRGSASVPGADAMVHLAGRTGVITAEQFKEIVGKAY